MLRTNFSPKPENSSFALRALECEPELENIAARFVEIRNHIAPTSSAVCSALRITHSGHYSLWILLIVPIHTFARVQLNNADPVQDV